jgi:hypothetical protein
MLRAIVIISFATAVQVWVLFALISALRSYFGTAQETSYVLGTDYLIILIAIEIQTIGVLALVYAKNQVGKQTK